MKVSWQELRLVCLHLGCVDSRTRGDHLIMSKPGLARPIVIKMDRNLGEEIIRSNMHTLGVTKDDFEKLLERVRRLKKTKHRNP